MSQYIVSPDARQDLSEIWSYIAAHNSIDRADHVIERLEKAMGNLADMPGMGRVVRRTSRFTIRMWPVWSYLIFYNPEKSPIEIVRVVHGARALPIILERE